MFNNYKENIGQWVILATITLIVVLIGFTFDKIVEKYIVPITITSMEKLNYIAYQENDVAVIRTQLKQMQIDNKMNIEKITVLENNISSLEKEYNDFRINNILQTGKLKAIMDILDAKTSNTLKVKLFISTRRKDRNHIVLNIKNTAINHLIQNGKRYEVCSDTGNCLELKSKVEIATDLESNNQTEAVGRIYETDYHQIFYGSTSGTRIGHIRLIK